MVKRYTELYKTQSGPLLRLSIPLILTGFVQSGGFYFETLFLARLGPDILSAGALVSWLYFTFAVIILGLLSSINILVSHHYGAENKTNIPFIVRDGFWLAVLIAIPATIFFWNMAPIFAWIGQSANLIPLAKAYLHGLAWGVFPELCLVVLLEVIMGLGCSNLILKINLISLILNIVFSYCLIFGRLGFPTLGIAGAGLGMSTSFWITFILVAIYIRFSPLKKYFKGLMQWKKADYLAELFKTGTSIGLMYGIEVGFFFVMTLTIGTFGNPLLSSANQITLQYNITVMMAVFSLAQAVTVRMGHLLGGKYIKPAYVTAQIGILYVMVIMSITFFLYLYLPHLLVSADFDPTLPANKPLFLFTKRLLFVAAIFQLFEALRVILFGALRSLKDTHFTLVISLISYWIIALPLGYLLATKMEYKAEGLWWGMVCGAFLASFVLYLRFLAKIKTYGTGFKRR